MTLTFSEPIVIREDQRIYVREYAGANPPILLLHGFPDNLHLYDALLPQLVKSGRRVIAFDFLGWGQSDKPDDHTYDHHSLTHDLDAVIRQLRLEGVVLVAHDASGPPAIDWALDHPAEIAGLVLLNTYYHATPALRAPEAIFAFSRLFGVGKAFQGLFEQGDLFHRLYQYQVGHFMRDSVDRNHFVPLLYQAMDGARAQSARKAFYGLNDDLVWTTLERSRRIPEMRQFKRPVRIIFGAGDPYLNSGVARAFHKLFPQSELFLLPEGRHFVQIDEPEQVGTLILQMPLADTVISTVSPSPKTRPALLFYRIQYVMFGLITILFSPVILFDRWLIYRRVQHIFQRDNGARVRPVSRSRTLRQL